MRRHTTSAFEFQSTGLLLAGAGEHEVRVLGALAELPAVASGAKEHLPTDASVYDGYFAGTARGAQDDPGAAPFHPQVPTPHLTRAGELEFLQRDWSGIDLEIPDLPETPAAPEANPVARWRGVLGSAARDGNDVVELIDGPETFRAMHAAIRTATGREHFIYLLGWWLDLDEPLDVPTTGPACPPAPRTGPSTIRALFTAASSAGVQVRVMLWDQTGSAKNTAEIGFVNSLANGAGILDNVQRAYLIGAHHQKLLVVKGSEGLIAFCGGIDINADRICGAGTASGSGSSGGEQGDGAVVASTGSSGGTGSPLHDVHCRIAGPGTHDLLGVFVKRWLSSADHVALDAAKGALHGIGEPVPPARGPAVVRAGETFNATATLPAPPASPRWRWWPGAGARTFNDRGVQEILLAVIAAARRYIYIEEQYLIAMCTAEALRRALPNVDHVTILIGASEIADLPQRWTLRRRFIDHIRADPLGRKLHVFTPCDPAAPPARRFGGHTYVHAKTLIADDEVAVIGSANVNRRGWEHDSEVVAAIAGNGRDGTPLARRLRIRLWAEHLRVAETAVADPVASHGLWTTAASRRVCPYVTTGGTDPATDFLIPGGEATIDPPFALAGAACCAIHPPSCPAGTPPPPPAPPPGTVDRWGNYDLRPGDADAVPRWAGAVRAAATGDEVPAAGTDGFVRRLQQDLRESGFTLVGTPDGDYGRMTQWAVRELQIYAKMATLAVEGVPGSAPVYGDRLAAVPNTARYGGPVSGVLNAATRAALTTWLANRWRCPVVIEALQGTAVVHENLWLKDDLQDSGPRMHARDWSGHYALPAGVAAGYRMVLGDWQSAGHGGPSSRAPAHTRADAELTPEALVGVPLTSLTPAQLSTFKAVRAVSEVECMGFFDSLNAWDNAIMSVGPCHWTLGLISGGGSVDEGELSAYLALLRHFEPADFATAVEFFGARPSGTWTDAAGTPSGAPLFRSSSRKYTTWMEQQQEGGTYAATPAQGADADYFRTWHWFHRFAMAGRTVAAFRRRMWDMARIRLRDIRATSWGAGPPAVPAVAGRPATIGDVFTSEQALAMVMRWHVWRPAHMINRGSAGPRLRAVLQRAGRTGDPSAWADADERALIASLTDEAAALGDAGLIQTLAAVRDWHTWGAGGGPRRYALPHTIADLADTRGSLQFDPSGLPPAP